ncbi:PTS sugar transporter subunit IIA [Sulfitobacter donghicola]|uniref:PTS lactose transporter subunit IIC n=1 Tax=Sulfitobacter donghicola DSW-25 = KCTC 12864 = JCM 14565 TaxID=1300350 RepID=A0A073IM93_9RHOB|nr:PTS sugar transporter subunit IIA [Sulfitobacter donghicola]KEJ90710.1 PTS lactose transporter subunit IIC [Sulfitobacter donghicola DSW-25 = KCTC 12864 = JCM 14565]KIN67963.1 Nitrogen regulatory IIA protein [Sulfitobacter donghicola DSW-25 = KCTC 12864 = JCM 14565]
MNFAKLITPEAVKVLSSTTSKKRLLTELGELAETVYGLHAQTVVEALIAREALGPTGVGHGVALPHARLEGVSEVTGLFVLLEKPVDFGSVDRQPVDIAFALFAPENAGVEHLKALALVSRTLRDTGICSKLRANPSANTLYTILTEAETVKAA